MRRKRTDKTAEHLMLADWRRHHLMQHRELQILEIDWPVAIDIIEVAITIILAREPVTEPPADPIKLLVTQALSQYTRASAIQHHDDGYRLYRTVEAMQRFLAQRYAMDVPLELLVHNPRVVGIIERVAVA